jgi:NAD(P)-dependent dehydrogenase (short-subunit alcohol dehydrogenase family)
VRTDVTSEADVAVAVAEAVEAWGRLDAAINNAGTTGPSAPTADYTLEQWNAVIALNLTGVFLCLKHEIPQMVEQGGGAIVNIASVAGIEGGAAGAAYTASKHALVGLTRNTAWTYAAQRVRCNAICPGGTRTNIAESMPQDRLDPTGATRAGAYAALIPATLEPDDIAALALFLSSDEAHLINGAIIPADAGWTAA